MFFFMDFTMETIKNIKYVNIVMFLMVMKLMDFTIETKLTSNVMKNVKEPLISMLFKISFLKYDHKHCNR